MYAHFKKLVYFSTECIFAPNAYRGTANKLYLLSLYHLSAKQTLQFQTNLFLMALQTSSICRSCTSILERFGENSAICYHGHYPFGWTNSIQGINQETEPGNLQSMWLRFVAAAMQSLCTPRRTQSRSTEIGNRKEESGRSNDCPAGQGNCNSAKE